MPATPRNFGTRTLPALALLGMATLAMPGCWYSGWHEGGDMNSRDKHVYISTAWQPKTIKLLDTRSGETLATWEVPVGKQLAMQFFDEQNKDDPTMPAILRWEIMKAGQEGGALTNSMPSPGRDARRLDWEFRPVAEYPPQEGDKNAAAPSAPATSAAASGN